MHKYAQRPEGPTSDEVIITTKSGNRYFIGDGLAINERRHTVCDLRANVGLIPDVIIGEKLTIPGLGHTTEVASVELKYKYGPGMGSRVLDMPNPFIQVSEYLQVANDHLRNIGARHNE